ncbi:MAG: alpha-L-rhamnosidase C-terminal domain-containing protein [Candidatus Acidiferrales bacterium]
MSMIRKDLSVMLLLAGVIAAAATARSQDVPPPASLDPAANAKDLTLETKIHHPLPEEFIWRADTADEVIAPHFFRARVMLKTVPRRATFYVTGPARATIFINGARAADFAVPQDATLRPKVFELDATRFLRAGENVFAIQAVAQVNRRFPKSLGQGVLLLAKLVPAGPQLDRPALLISGPSWKVAVNAKDGWEKPSFADGDWEPAVSYGSAESNIDLFQWNVDTGLYRWPGYDGISAFLGHVPVEAKTVRDPFEGIGHFHNLGALTGSLANKQIIFSVELPAGAGGSPGTLDELEAPSLVLDFGQETTGRIEVISASDQPIRMTVRYGESYEEAVKKPYLGVASLMIPPHATVHGPKSSFRFAKLQFFGDGPLLRFVKIRVDGIYYPVEYRGSFESSDPQLNRIWQVGAYTAHLCMQDDIWDAPKRDRGRWMGDLDVSGRTIETAFADQFLMEDTIRRLNPVTDAGAEVNGIPGYSAFWIMGLADYYRQTGKLEFVQAMLPNLRELLNFMAGDLDPNNVFANQHRAWPFVDWSSGLFGDTPESRRATQFEYYRAFHDAAFLLRETGDAAGADDAEKRAMALRSAAELNLLDMSTGTFGDRWQTNAMAIYSGLASPAETAAIRKRIFTDIDAGKLPDYDVSPYYGDYILEAMAQAGDLSGAMNFLRMWWGGMIEEGATSFWEGYDPRWQKIDFHNFLHADNGMGYQVSLAHGWSSGPTSWLTEHVLGIEVTSPGYRTVMIAPNLLGLDYAKGAQPTPNGEIRVEFHAAKGIDGKIELPAGTTATVSLPVSSSTAEITVDGKTPTSRWVEGEGRREVDLTGPGSYSVHAD